MNVVVSSTGRWAVSARPTGEDLVARCDAGDISITRFGPELAARAEVEGQLRSLIEASREAATQSPVSGPIPALLHQVLARLLASDVPNSGGALIVFDDGRDATVATIGEVEARLQLDGSDAHLPWVRVRDRSGHEARAYPVPADRHSAFGLQWPHNREPGAPGVEIDARWPVSIVDAPRETHHEAGDVALAQPLRSGRVPSYAEDDRVSQAREADGMDEKEGFLQWFDRMRGRRSQGSDDVDRMASERIPPSPEPDWLTGSAVDPTAVHRPADNLAPIDSDAMSEPTLAVDHEPAPIGDAPKVQIVGGHEPAAEPFAHAPKFEIVGGHEPAAEPFARVPKVEVVGRHEPAAEAFAHAPRIEAIRGYEPLPTPTAHSPRVDVIRAHEPSPAPTASTPGASFAPSDDATVVGITEAAVDEPAASESLMHQFGPVMAQAPVVARVVPPRRLEWPEPEKLRVPAWKKPWTWGVLVVALLCGAVLVATFANRSRQPGRSLLAAFGPHFSVTVNSRPAGAWIAIDGKDTGRLTPASLDLTPGEHQVTLTIAGKGSTTVPVTGKRNERTSIDAALYGGVRVASADPRIPIAVALDGLDRGYAPVSMEDLLPGPHEIRFRAPGMDPWTETFEVRVGQTHELVARAFSMPDNGVLEVRTAMVGDGAGEPLKGATIYIDGEPRGTTPAQFDLPHGPHSIRVAYRGEDLPVQVIDLPGGNHRFVDFAFGTGIDAPRMVQTPVGGAIVPDQPAVISSSITGIAESELKEMWLHVRSPERTWKRYEMTLLRAAGGVVGVAVFPSAMIDANGGATYYTSAVMQVGDEFYTELRGGRRESRSAPKSSRASRASLAPQEPTLPAIPATGAETP